MCVLHFPELPLLVHQPVNLEKVDGDEYDVPRDTGMHRAASEIEVDDLERQADHRDHAQPVDVREIVRDRDQKKGRVPRHVGPDEWDGARIHAGSAVSSAALPCIDARVF